MQSFTELVLRIFSISIFRLLCLTLLPIMDNFILLLSLTSCAKASCACREPVTYPSPPHLTKPLLISLNLPSLNRVFITYCQVSYSSTNSLSDARFWFRDYYQTNCLACTAREHHVTLRNPVYLYKRCKLFTSH